MGSVGSSKLPGIGQFSSEQKAINMLFLLSI